MISDERLIEIIAARAEEECGFSTLSTVLNHYSWIDVFTHLLLEKHLRGPLIAAYKGDIANALAMESLDSQLETGALAKEKMAAMGETGADYLEWKADVQTRGGS